MRMLLGLDPYLYGQVTRRFTDKNGGVNGRFAAVLKAAEAELSTQKYKCRDNGCVQRKPCRAAGMTTGGGAGEGQRQLNKASRKGQPDLP